MSHRLQHFEARTLMSRSLRSRIAPFSLIALLMLTAPAAAIAHDGEGEHDHNASTPIMTTRTDASVIAPPKPDDGFQFIIYGDRTGGVPAGLKVLEQAVEDTNLLDPDLVMTVGDLIQGYNETEQWLEEASEYKEIMDRLKMRWFPVAGNHDIYWRGSKKAPAGHHETNYETHFGPLWYSFKHKNAGFIVLYSDEGDPKSNLKAFNVGALQQMSKAQLEFLEKALKDLQGQDHVFVFLHHPRWIGGGYTGSNWDEVHERLKDAGNVSAVFAGHIHRMRFDGARDGIEYYALATTGGHVPGDTPIPGAGYLHHFNVVSVRENRFTVAALPVGAVFDPKQFTQEFLADIELARSIRPEQSGDPVTLQFDGAAEGEVKVALKNPASRPVEVSVSMAVPSLENRWTSNLDHKHFVLQPNESKSLEFTVGRFAVSELEPTNPTLLVETRYLGENAAVELPPLENPIPLQLDLVPADFFATASNHVLEVRDETSAIEISDDAFELPEGPFTMETWVRPISAKDYEAIVAKTQSSEYSFFSDHGIPKFDVHIGGRYVSAIAKSSLPLGEWTHLAGVYDGNSISLFVNGKRVDSQQATGKRKGNDLPLFLGADPDAGGNPTRGFSGFLDEFRLSKIARYKADFSPKKRFEPDDETVLLHHFDRSVGPFLLDHSPSAANGILGKTSLLVPAE
ncbi:MAG: LamG-like jellyroll fold domain-containing protein [Planctomycetota bacterium]